MPSSSHFLCLGLHRRWIASYEVDYRQEAEWALARFDEQFPRASRRRSKPLDGGAAYEERFLISDEGGGWDVGVIFRLSREGDDYGNFVQFVGLRPRAWLLRCICMRGDAYDFELKYWRAIRMAFDDLERLMRWRRSRIVRRRLALAMALHGRLGAASPLAGLGLDLVQRVADALVA